jgi:hypothetical protein
VSVREVHTFDSFAAADDADLAYYRALTPKERLDVLLELVARFRESLDEAEQRFARVHRVVDLRDG